MGYGFSIRLPNIASYMYYFPKDTLQDQAKRLAIQRAVEERAKLVSKISASMLHSNYKLVTDGRGTRYPK